ncbi:MAG: hypothetical protein R3F48_07830 [Candidatus Zixiibacteriota bacterium]
MVVHKGDLNEVRRWSDEQASLLNSLYSIEVLYSSQYPIGFPGIDENFQNDLFITEPPVPDGIEPEYIEFDVVSKKMSPLPVVECLSKFGPEICIVGGELHWRVYSKEFLEELLIQLKYSKSIFPNGKLPFRARIVCGPIALTKDGRPGQRLKGTILPDLINHADIEVYHSRYRQIKHFRQNPMAVYSEERHAPNAIERKGYAYYYDREKLKEYQELKINILKDPHVTLCKSIEDIEKKFLFLTESEMDRLVKVIAKEHKDREKPEEAFDELDVDGLRQYFEKAKIVENKN